MVLSTKVNMENFASSWWPMIISFVISIIGAIRFYMAGPKCPPEIRADNLIVLITGATSGIGLETAKELIQRGATVILTGRSEDGLAIACREVKTVIPNAKMHSELLDVSSMENIRSFAKNFYDKYEKLDVLINNAGVIFQKYVKTTDDLEITMATNYFGPFLLTHLLLPALRKSQGGRVISLSSMAHYGASLDVNNLNSEIYYNDKELFGRSKLALLLFSNKLSTLLKYTKITSNCVHPGIVRNTKHFKQSPLQSSWMIKVSTWPWVWLFLKSPKQGCQTVLYAAIEPSISNYSGRYFSDCEQKEPSVTARDNALATQLYNKSLQICNITNNIKQD